MYQPRVPSSPRPLRSAAAGGVIVAFLAILAITACVFFAYGWLLMIALGAAHSHDVRVPAFGFWTSVWLAVPLVTLTGGIRVSSR